MKTKITLVLIACVSLSSCIKDYHGHGPKKVELTSKNYLYEGDLYGFYLTTEIKNLDEKIKELGTIKPDEEGYDKAKIEIAAAEKQKKEFDLQIEGIVDLSQFGIVDPDNPIGPCICWGLNNGLEFLVTVPGTRIQSISILGPNGKTISKVIAEFSPLPDFDNQVLYQQFMIAREVQGELFIKVEKVGEDGKLRDYTIPGYFHK